MIKILAGKIHRVRVTDTDVEYVGSIGIDPSMLEQAGICPYQEVEVWNVTNGKRFSTYAVPAAAKACTVYGAAARLVAKGDVLIIAAFSYVERVAGTVKIVLVDPASNTVDKVESHALSNV